jgi:hypothetical protein
MFSFAVTSLPCRDNWIGWQDSEHKKHLNLVVNNRRFLILPWVKAKYLTSKTLSLAHQQLADDWGERYGYRPVLIETFVDLMKSRATCYRAANWLYLGKTNQRATIKTEKGVYLYPLVKNTKPTLINGPKAKPKKTKESPARRPPPLTKNDPFVQLWGNIISTVEATANDFDRQWQKRKRILNTLLIMLFIFRLVFSKDKQGYTITTIELWEQCRQMNIALRQTMRITHKVLLTAFIN